MRNLTRTTLLLAALSVVPMGCGSSDDGRDPNTDGPRSQAIERLHDYGLPTDEATCVVDAIGAETVVETASIDALVQGAAFEDAMKECRDAS